MFVFQVLFIKIEAIQESEFDMIGIGAGSSTSGVLNTENKSNNKIKVSAFSPSP